MFLLRNGRHVCAPLPSPQKAQTWRLRTKLYKFGWHTSSNSMRMRDSRDLNLDEAVYIAIIDRIPDYWIYLLNGYDF